LSGAHQHLLLFRPDREMWRDRSRLVHVERDAILHVFLKAFRCNLQAVVPDRKFQKNIVTVAIGGRRARQGRFRLLCCYLGTHNDSATWVCHCSAKVPRDLLRSGMEASNHYKCQHIANDVHVVFESPERFGTTNRATPVVRMTPC
jgi:hypothetical protein